MQVSGSTNGVDELQTETEQCILYNLSWLFYTVFTKIISTVVANTFFDHPNIGYNIILFCNRYKQVKFYKPVDRI